MDEESRTRAPSLLQGFGFYLWTRLRGLRRDWIDLVEIAGMHPATVTALGQMREPPSGMAALDQRRLLDALAFHDWGQLLSTFESWRDGNATMFWQDRTPGTTVVHLPPPNTQTCVVTVELDASLVRSLQAWAATRGASLCDVIADALAAQVGVGRRADDASGHAGEQGSRVTSQRHPRPKTPRLRLLEQARCDVLRELWADLEAVRAERCATAGDTVVPLLAQVPLKLVLELDDLRRVARIAQLPLDDQASCSDSAAVTAGLRGYLSQLRRGLREVLGERPSIPQPNNRHDRRSAREPEWII